MEADNNSIDQMVADKVKTLSDSLDKACTDATTAAVDAKMDSLAKSGHKAAVTHVASHPKPAATAPAPKKEEPAKPATVGNGKPSMNGTSGTNGTVGNGKPNMNTTPNTDGKTNSNTVGNGKPKM